MADYCTKCARYLFGEEAVPAIDVMKEFEELEKGFCSSGWLCEKCGLVAITRTENDELRVIRASLDEEKTDEWQEY